jgi:ribosomal protein S6E (S10)
MKRLLTIIFILIFSCNVFATTTLYKFEVVVPENEFNYDYTDTDSDFFFISAKGIGDSNSEIDNIYLYGDTAISSDYYAIYGNITDNPESLGDGFEKYTYLIEIQGGNDKNGDGYGDELKSSNTVKIVLNYLYPRDPDATLPSPFYESNILDYERRFMVGEVDGDSSKVENRTYIKYSDVEDFMEDSGIPASKEYNLPAGSGTDVNAYPLYQYDETYDNAYDSFKNGNVITHLYDVKYTPDEDDGITTTTTTTDKKGNITTTTTTIITTSTGTTITIDNDTITTVSSGGTTVWDIDDPLHYTDLYYEGETSDIGNDGLHKWYEDHVVSNIDDHDPSAGKYYRGYLTITKYVWFDPQNSEDATPPNSTIESMKIKARTSGSSRQRTSSIEINAGEYDEVLTTNPNPFKITEMEERGIN